MTSYPNKDALYKALDICRDAMREFIFEYLEKRVYGETVEELIERISGGEARGIDVRGILDIFLDSNCWNDYFEERFGYDKQQRRVIYDIRSVTRMVINARNEWAHPGADDLDPEFTRAHLFLIADVLKEIGKLDAKREVEDIRDQLFSDDLEGQPAQVDQIAAYKKRLATMSTRLAVAVAGKTTAEERLSDISNRLEEAEVEKTELEKHLKTVSDRLKDVERENAAYKKRIETIPDQLETANAGKTKYEKALKAASSQLATLKTVNTQLEERLETTSVQLEEVEEELADCQERLAQLKVVAAEETAYEEDFAELKERLPLNANTPDSVTFQGTIFTKRLNEYHVAGDDISQSFWYYWQSQGREGKQEMRDAGWSVEKVDEEWEVAISPEDFQAWIEDEVTELNSLLNFSRNEEPSTQPIRPFYERTSLPTVREMEQPALKVLADGKEHRRVEIINLLTEYFSLTDDERSYLSKTGQAEKHLMSEGLIERTRTGYYRITTLGRRKVRTA